jgi:hypothetical protein
MATGDCQPDVDQHPNPRLPERSADAIEAISEEEQLDKSAVALHNGELGREPTEEALRELGIDSANNITGEQEPPDVLKESMSRRTFSGEGDSQRARERRRV